MKKYVLVIDEGTTSTRAMIFTDKMTPVASSQKRFTQFFPRNGWVEHDAEEIYEKVLETIKEAMEKGNVSGKDIISVGITNQRETIVPFDKNGRPVHRAIVWQCRRTTEMIKSLKETGIEEEVHRKTGLFLDPYFSGSKIRWLKENVDEARNALFGTIDAFLVFKLSGGHSFKTDPSNASRTLLFNINTMQYDKDLLDTFKVDESALPSVRDSASIFGKIKNVPPLLDGTPISGILGDQQAALFGHGGIKKGLAKNTYGTGSFLLVNTGEKPEFFERGILTTVASEINGKTQYAIEGSVFIVGALIDWLKDIGLIKDVNELNEILKNGTKTNIYFVPAFTGLGAPHWDPQARGGMFGLTRDTRREDIVRGAVLSIPLQTEELLRAVRKNGIEIKEMHVDGGVSNSDYIMQLQSDISNIKIMRPKLKEITAKGAALISAVGAGLISLKDVEKFSEIDKVFTPHMTMEEREKMFKTYEKAVERVKKWEV